MSKAMGPKNELFTDREFAKSLTPTSNMWPWRETARDYRVPALSSLFHCLTLFQENTLKGARNERFKEWNPSLWPYLRQCKIQMAPKGHFASDSERKLSLDGRGFPRAPFQRLLSSCWGREGIIWCRAINSISANFDVMRQWWKMLPSGKESLLRTKSWVLVCVPSN